MKVELKKIYISEREDMASLRFHNITSAYSEEFKTENGQEFVIDMDKTGKITAIEIFDFNEFKQPSDNMEK